VRKGERRIECLLYDVAREVFAAAANRKASLIIYHIVRAVYSSRVLVCPAVYGSASCMCPSLVKTSKLKPELIDGRRPIHPCQRPRRITSTARWMAWPRKTETADEVHCLPVYGADNRGLQTGLSSECVCCIVSINNFHSFIHSFIFAHKNNIAVFYILI